MEVGVNRVTETSLRESIIAGVVLSLCSKPEPELSIMQQSFLVRDIEGYGQVQTVNPNAASYRV